MARILSDREQFVLIAPGESKEFQFNYNATGIILANPAELRGVRMSADSIPTNFAGSIYNLAYARDVSKYPNSPAWHFRGEPHSFVRLMFEAPNTITEPIEVRFRVIEDYQAW
jgi:hypothetical protein